jgi:3-keto-disaccharide hydrolase
VFHLRLASVSIGLSRNTNFGRPSAALLVLALCSTVVRLLQSTFVQRPHRQARTYFLHPSFPEAFKMKRTKKLTLALLCIAIIGSTANASEDGFVSIFDGKTFDGWEGNLKVFRVEDGMIVAGSEKEPVAHNDFLCTKKKYGDFELRLKARLIGPGDNAGIQFRTARIPNHHEVIGYQCDMGSAWGRKIWGALYDESRRRKLLAEGDPEKVAEIHKADDWNEFVIRCEGNHIQIWLNGLQTVDYIEKEDVARTGVIGLQIHGGKPAEAAYKDIRIKELN